jgi:hypothetical protein
MLPVENYTTDIVYINIVVVDVSLIILFERISLRLPAGLKRDDPCAETRFRLSEKRTSPFESAGASA